MKLLRWLLGIAATLAILFVAIGIVRPEVSYENRVVVNAERTAAFTIFCDTSQMDKWLTGFQSMEKISGQAMQAGSQWRVVFNEQGREVVMTEEVTEFVSDELLAFSLYNDVLDAEVTVAFSDTGDGATEIIASNRVVGKNSFWKSMLALTQTSMVARGQENYERLKQLIESSPAQDSDAG